MAAPCCVEDMATAEGAFSANGEKLPPAMSYGCFSGPSSTIAQELWRQQVNDHLENQGEKIDAMLLEVQACHSSLKAHGGEHSLKEIMSRVEDQDEMLKSLMELQPALKDLVERILGTVDEMAENVSKTEKARQDALRNTALRNPKVKLPGHHGHDDHGEIHESALSRQMRTMESKKSFAAEDDSSSEDGDGKKKKKKKKKKKGLKHSVKEAGRRLSEVANTVSSAWANLDSLKGKGVTMPKKAKKRREEVEDIKLTGLKAFVHGKCFESTSALVVALFTVFMALQIQWDADNLHAVAPPNWITIADMCFFCCFTIELVLHLAADKLQFFTSKEKAWNIFDMSLVVIAIPDFFVSIALLTSGPEGAGDGFGGSFMFLRVVRVLRVMRVLKAFKISPQLTNMLRETVKSLKAVMWLFLLVFFIIFNLSLVCMTAITDYRKGAPPGTEIVLQMETWFGSLPATALSLFKTMSGGLAWSIISDTLMEVSLGYGILFLLYIGFAVFGILNVVTGVFVESARDTTTQTELENKAAYMAETKIQLMKMGRVFPQHDEKEEYIDRDEFHRQVETSPHLRDLLQRVDIDVAEATYYFDLLAVDSEHDMVEIDVFTSEFLRLLGQARSVDLLALHLENRQQHMDFLRFRSYVEACFDALGQSMETLLGQNVP
eukprot:TRINITY_DN7768_c0_g3_i1.p1 TRINITY_DN7768_c0_g3~~TRINITY_DN7768_c0_g3_i1.p1  ORF type:complete len:663 (+),score=132.78 TRINITY_DN7768_c0_g3_i1:157-2145(+)